MKNTATQIQNPITPVDFFYTPDNIIELQDILARYTAPGESIVAQAAAFMAWNLASKMVEEALADKNVNPLAGTQI